MKTRHLIALMQSLGVIVIGCLLILAAGARARANAMIAFSNYRSDWPDAWRAPVEHQAVDVLGKLLPTPGSDLELVRAALGVMRDSASWKSMANDIRTQLRGSLDTLIKKRDLSGIRVVWELFALTDPDNRELYHERIIALGGDRTAAAEAVHSAAARLREAVNGSAADVALIQLGESWDAMLAPLDGQPLPWLARLSPVIMRAETEARSAVLRHHRQLLEPYGVPAEGDYGQTVPNQAMIDWLSRTAQSVNAADPEKRKRMEHFQYIQRQHTMDLPLEPVVAIATRIAVRHDALPWSAIIPGLGIAFVLIGGLIGAGLRFRRGPLPIDVNAETMENVEPIDLDTDAETRSRSAAAITDVG